MTLKNILRMLQTTIRSTDNMKIKNKRFCVDLPEKLHNKIWRQSGFMKINLVVQCLIIEYLTDSTLQHRVRIRMNSGRIENK